MAKITPPVAGTVNGLGPHPFAFTPNPGDFNLSMNFTGFTGSVRLECSQDGTNWFAASFDDGQPMEWSGSSVSAGTMKMVLTEPESGWTYRLNCIQWGAGTMTWRFGQ